MGGALWVTVLLGELLEAFLNVTRGCTSVVVFAATAPVPVLDSNATDASVSESECSSSE